MDRALARAQKKARRQGRTIVWVDESGFYLLPARVRTYAPRGQTPLLRVPLTRDHLAAIGALTADGRLLLRAQERAVQGPDVVRFLRQLLRHLAGKLLVLWDGAPIHHAQAVKQFLSHGGAERLHLESLPGYAPELNPEEGIWDYLKRVELRNLCCSDQRHLRRALCVAAQRLRRKPHIMQGCIRQAGYHV